MKRLLISLALITSLLFALACQTGGGGGDKVRIGVFMSLTGDTANFGISSTNGIKMAADEVNAAGGINGKQIELLVQDDRSDASEAATIVTKFVTQDQVHAILGEVASSRSIAAAPIAQNAKIPMLTPSSTNPEVTKKGDYIFRSCFIDPVQGAAIAQFGARTLNAKRAALMVDRKNDYSTGLEKVISDVFTKLGGQIVVTQSYQAGDQDFNAQITSIKGANPDVIFVPGYYGDVGLFAKQARDKGITVPLLGGDGWDSPSLYQIGGAALNGCYFSNHYSPDDADPLVQKFVSDYKARYGTVPDALAATAYDAAKILFDAIKRAPSLDGAAIRDALAATKEFPGVTGKVTFNENRDAVKPIVMIKIQEGGKFVVAERVQVEGAAMPTTTTSASPVVPAPGASPAAPNTAASPATKSSPAAAVTPARVAASPATTRSPATAATP
ncbi:MAG: branched-chain amino acid transport system substrate-binding protein [Pyrinomonadaceae bacterium]|jgi:branched-chain amino acid transport system substrate-binding protein|nr:branched-chain amino acid transport system substrate-binding protein [Pyrinomonadaceae bacterium]